MRRSGVAYSPRPFRADPLGPWLVGVGIFGVVTGLLVSRAGLLVALGCAVALAVRGHRLAALAVPGTLAVLLVGSLLLVGGLGLDETVQPFDAP